MATYLIKEMVVNNERHSRFVDSINFHILPVANPDGYEYSRRSPEVSL